MKRIGIIFLYKVLNLEMLRFVLRHSSVPLISGRFFRWAYVILTFFISKDKTIEFTLSSWAQGMVLLSTQIKCHVRKKQLSIIFIHPHPICLPLWPTSLSWCTAALVCYHIGGSQGRVKSLRRNVMVTITATICAVSQILEHQPSVYKESDVVRCHQGAVQHSHDFWKVPLGWLLVP